MPLIPTFRPPRDSPAYEASDPQDADPAPPVENYSFLDENGRVVKRIGDRNVLEPHLNAAAFGAKADDEDAALTNITSILAAIAKGDSEKASAFFQPGTYYVGRSLFASLALVGKRNVRLWAQPGTVTLRQIRDVANGATEAKNVKASAMESLTIDGLILDGGWENAATSVSSASHLVTMFDGMTINVESTEYSEGVYAPFPTFGTFELVTKAGVQIVAYTNKTATSFINCTGVSGVLRQGDAIIRSSIYIVNGTIAAASNGANLQVVTSLRIRGGTANWPAAVSVVGQVCVQTDAGPKFITYTSKTADTIEGVAGGTGHVVGADDGSGSSISYYGGALGQLPTRPQDFTIDAKNHGGFFGSEDGDVPCVDIHLVNCRVVNQHGDGFWFGRATRRVLIENCLAYLCARNCLTLSNNVEDVTVVNSRFVYASTSEIDAEPVEGFTRRVRMHNVQTKRWPNPGEGRLNITMSIVGGSSIRPAEYNYSKDWQFTNCDFIGGSVLVENARGITFTASTFDNDAIPDVAIGDGPLHVSADGSEVILRDCTLRGRIGGTSDANKGVVTFSAYRMTGPISLASNAALVPSEVSIRGGLIRARGGLRGVFAGAVGGYGGATVTAIGYTRPTNQGGLGEIALSGTPLAGKTDFYIGRKVLLDGKLAIVVANNASTLFIYPIGDGAAAFSAGHAWSDRHGRATSDPQPTIGSPLTATILPVGGWISIEDVTIDCGASDDAAAGGSGIEFDPSTTFDEGYNQIKLSARNVTILNATGPAVYIRGRGASNPGVYAELELVDIKVRDEQPTKTTTVGVKLDFPEMFQRIELHGITTTPGIPRLEGHTAIPHYESASSEPPQYTGYELPEGELPAPLGSTFFYPPGNARYVKQTSDAFSTGWVRMKAGFRIGYLAAGAFPAGVQNGSLVVPPPARIASATEFLVVISNDAHGAVVLSDAKGFELVSESAEDAIDPDTHLGFTIRLSIFARDMSTSSGAPTIDASNGGKFAISRIVSVDDLLPGAVADSIDDLTTLTHASGSTTFSFALPTSSVPEALCIAFIATHTGGSPTSNLVNVANGQAGVSELQTVLDAGQVTLGDRYTISVVTMRRSEAGSFGTLSGDVNVTSPGTYAFIMGVALALKPREE